MERRRVARSVGHAPPPLNDPAAHSLPERDEPLLARLAEVADKLFRPYFRADVRGLERIPRGAALFVGNHNAGLLAPEAFLLFGALRHRALSDVPYALTGDLLVAVPALERAAAKLGLVRARPEVALRLLAGDAKVLVYPGGDVESMRPYADRDRIVFGGRRGYIRLALRAGVPIVPVVAAGAHSTFIVLSDGRRLLRRRVRARLRRAGRVDDAARADETRPRAGRVEVSVQIHHPSVAPRASRPRALCCELEELFLKGA